MPTMATRIRSSIETAREYVVERTTRRGGHQVSTVTEFDRYPAIFAAAAAELGAFNAGPVLSYGCSTGEECFTLRDYLPDARIVGADVNDAVLRACAAANHDDRIAFVRSEPGILSEHGPFTAVFAMSVLCRHPATEHLADASDVYPFARFAEAIRGLDDLLAPAGLLVLYNTNYRFEDTPTAAGYVPVVGAPTSDPRVVTLFDPAGRRLHDARTPCSIYRKTTADDTV